jgi:thymidylate synthase (FAD)
MEVQRIILEGDLGVVNSARVSFGKWKTELDDKDYKLIEYLKKHNHKSPFFHPQVCFVTPEVSNTNLIKFILAMNANKLDIAGFEWDGSFYFRMSLYLFIKERTRQIIDMLLGNIEVDYIYDNNWLEIEYSAIKGSDLFRASRLPYLQFRIKAPIFVVRQLEKHTVGFAKNERSLRYTTFEPEFWQPEKWRKQSETNKQGSNQNEFVNDYRVDCGENVGHNYYTINKLSRIWYKINIRNGMCGEQARAILPLATYTEFVWTASLQDYARLCALRLENNAQQETREVVKMIYDLCKEEYPIFDKIIEFIKQN